MKNKPLIITGGFFEDTRGRLDFVNDFDLTEIKRMYFTTNSEVGFFRGWQGHEIESRWFHCVKGKFEICLIKIDNWESPSNNLLEEIFVLKASEPQVLYIPAGYVNGFSSLEENSKLMILSNFKLGENPNDDFRYENDKWKK
jgi:dTDP-4-dehydrorhamnose 3,5-epimerase-like enzyme